MNSNMNLADARISTVNKALACPEKLYTSDGREIFITVWNPKADIKSGITVEISGAIHIPDYVRSEP